MRVVTEMGSELDYGVVVGMEWCMEFCIDGVCSELERGNIPEMERGSTPEMEHGNIPEMERGNIPEMVAESYVPLQLLKAIAHCWVHSAIESIVQNDADNISL